MEYVKGMNFLENPTNEPFGSETKKWVEANDIEIILHLKIA